MIAPWLAGTHSSLSKRIAQGTLRGGILLLGDPGLGTQTLADSLAAVFLCEGRGEIACGECSGCRWASQKQHPDLLVLSPEEDSVVIKVDAVRAMSEMLEKKSARGGYQVVIIADAEALNIASSNALLKTLEEPPGDVVFVLCCREKRSLLPTILSRCEQCVLPTPSVEQATQWLAVHYPQLSSPEQWLRWAKQAPYAVGAFLDNKYDHWRNRLFDDYLSMVSSPGDALSLTAGWQKASLSIILDIVSSLMSDLIRLQLGGGSDCLVHQDREEVLRQLLALVSPSSLWRYHDYLVQVRQHQHDGILNERLIRDELLLRWEADSERKREEIPC